MAKVKATIMVNKSFYDDGKGYQKEWEKNDFEKFFNAEGKYLDELSKIVMENAKDGEGFNITYVINVAKKD